MACILVVYNFYYIFSNDYIMVTFEEIKENIDLYTDSIEDGNQESLIAAENNIERLLNEANQEGNQHVINRALNYAVKSSHEGAVTIIIDNGGDVNSEIDGQTPIVAILTTSDHHNNYLKKMLIKNLLNNGARKPETINGKSINDFINDEINNLHNDRSKPNERTQLEEIRIELDTTVNRGGRKRKRTQKKKNKNKKRKSSKSKKRKSRRTRKHRK